MGYDVKVGDPVEFWFTDEQGDTHLLNGHVAFIEQRLDEQRPTVVCGTKEVIKIEPYL